MNLLLCINILEEHCIIILGGNQYYKKIVLFSKIQDILNNIFTIVEVQIYIY